MFIISSPYSLPRIFLLDHLLLSHQNVSDGKLDFAFSGSGWFSPPEGSVFWRQKLLWYLWIHSPFPWVPEAVLCMRKAVQTWANPSTSLSLLFPICQMKLLLPFHPAFRCRGEVYVSLSLNTPKVCSATVLYNYKYKASSWLFLLALYLLYLQNLNNFQNCLSQMLMYPSTFLLYQSTDKLNI